MRRIGCETELHGNRQAVSGRGQGATGFRKHVQPWPVYLLMALLLLLASSALYGGFLLIVDPTGALLGMPTELLDGSPFSDYLLPGIVLFGLLGVMPLLTLGAMWVLPTWTPLPRIRVGVAWLAGIVAGAALIVWIAVQMSILRFFLQPILLGLGIAIIIVSFLPGVRGHFTESISESLDHDDLHRHRPGGSVGTKGGGRRR